MTAYVGVDVGGTRIRALLQDAQGRIMGRAASLTDANEGPQPVLARIMDTICEAVGQTPWSEIRGIGVGLPGPVDPWAGVLRSAPNLPGWRGVPIRDIIAQRFGAPTRVGNDANLAALGEHVLGAGQGVRNLIYMTISTGIGGGIIADGKLLLGHEGFAGEFGHLTIIPDGPLCGCGNHGCLEALASGTAIARLGQEAVASGRGQRMAQLAGGVLEAIDAALVAKAALEGDDTALGILRQTATFVGIGLANVVNMLNPELIILGGGVTHIGDLLFDTIRATLAVRAMPVMRHVRVVPTSLGDDVVLLGAIALLAAAVGRE